MGTLTFDEEKLILSKYDALLNSCVRCDKPEDRTLIEKAFRIAFESHKEMRRRSGEPYILHPLEVATIVTKEIGLGVKSIIASLLHDVVEDTDYSLEEIERGFGTKIASIIDGLTKIGEIYDSNSSLQAENFRKMLLTLSDDVRVILIKLADRLHNMRTLESMPRDKQIKISSETIYLYAPLAHRMGLYTLKTELEDLSLKYRYPDAYNEIEGKINASKLERKEYIENFSEPIIANLEAMGIKYVIEGRTKSIYSIWNKMQAKNVPFEDIFDLFAIRIIFEPLNEIPEKTQCWNIYSSITDNYMPKPDRIRDWISSPKSNGYEALHVTVMGPNGKWVEVQIRSKRMDEIAEKGFAAHWKYKQNASQENELDRWLKQIRELLENPQPNALEFLDDFKLNLFASEILVFTPKGDLRPMPKDSTALDFAFDIHSKIGIKTIGAKVNHKLVPLTYTLCSGDQVEIITSDKQKIQRQWLDIVKTAKAKTAIKNALKSETKNRIEKGRQIIEARLKDLGLHPSNRVFKKLLPAYEVTSKEELYSKIGAEIINLDNLDKVIRKNTKSKWIRYWELTLGMATNALLGDSSDDETDEEVITRKKYTTKAPFILRENADEATSSYTIAKCCTPIPGDEVIGYRSLNEQITIHKAKCPNAVKLLSSQSDRVVPTKWTAHKIMSFLARISVNGIERFGIYNSITTIISKELNVNIRNIHISSHDGIFEGYLDLYVHNVNDLSKLITNLSKTKGIEKVTRVENFEEDAM